MSWVVFIDKYQGTVGWFARHGEQGDAGGVPYRVDGIPKTLVVFCVDTGIVEQVMKIVDQQENAFAFPVQPVDDFRESVRRFTE